MIGNVLAVLLGYLIGAIPLGLIMAKALKGIDIRDYGSGKIGATNVLRTVGLKAAVVVFAFDLGKGVAAVFIARGMGDATYVEVLAAGAAFAGHNWSVFIRFTGGRGVNTGLGGLFAMAPLWAAGAVGAGILVIVLTRYVSLGSLTGATFGLVALLVLAATGHGPWEYAGYAVAVVTLIYFQHWGNMQRLARGEERRLGQSAEIREPTKR
ncbi:MAG: glycerol-3-phosphate 1-O-acyltransferase PlsY [Chloroflexi bacterium]|nr:glycerol-3-phosphate 1-O-acyltransferase PlsY [Chloroflexota bacterium]